MGWRERIKRKGMGDKEKGNKYEEEGSIASSFY